jgi:4-aminobutyrate aminotransferase/(S)-3-amino-2-methylpropionate transaminase
MGGEGYPFALEPVDVPPVETAYRRIVTPQPPPGTCQLVRSLREHEPESMTDELPVQWERATGFRIEDPYGNAWLDFTSGIFVANVGHGHPQVTAAIREAVDAPLLHTYTFPHRRRRELTARLAQLSPADAHDTVLLLSTGAEATEAAIKMARIQGGPSRSGIVSLSRGFHGKTMGAQTAGGRAGAKKWIGQLDPNFHLLPVPFAPLCPWGPHPEGAECDETCFAHAISVLEDTGVDLDSIAAFLMEPYQGWSAAMLPVRWVRALREWADARGVLVVFDEIQAGLGRTGRLFAHEHLGVAADLICVGKGLSSGLPVSAVIGPRRLIDGDGSFTTTHSGNPVGTAAALATLDVLTSDGVLEHAAVTGERLGARVRELMAPFADRAPRVLGVGMVWAVHLVDPATGELDGPLGDVVIERAMRKGLLLVRTGTGTVKLGPPITMPLDAALEGAEVLGEAVAEAVAERTAVATR